MFNKSYYKLLSVFVLAAGIMFFQACGDDDPVSVDEDPPSVPSLQNVEVDDSYFQQNQVPQEDQGNEMYHPYMQAQATAIGMSGGLNEALAVPNLFLLVSAQEQPEYQDGEWVWDFEYTVDGALVGEDVPDFTVQVNITAVVNEAANNVSWDYRFSGENTPFGDVNNFQIFSINSSLDNSSGEMDFFSPLNPGEPTLSLEWGIDSQDQKTITATFVDDEGEEPTLFNLSYVENGDEFQLNLDEQNGASIEIFWDISAPEGYITFPSENGQTTCWWGADLAVTSCE